MDQHVTLGPGIESVRIDTPDGVISVTYIPQIGTSTCVYKDPNHNPVGIVHLDPVAVAPCSAGGDEDETQGCGEQNRVHAAPSRGRGRPSAR